MTLTVISDPLCPFGQSICIALAEKGVAFDRAYRDAAQRSNVAAGLVPWGRGPALKTQAGLVFEPSAILEYLEETQVRPLHPAAAFDRARHRAAIAFSAAILADINQFCSTESATEFSFKLLALKDSFAKLEADLPGGDFFDSSGFSLVDAGFAPVFRYFETFDQIGDFGILMRRPKVAQWRLALMARGSVQAAAGPDYGALLLADIRARPSHLAGILVCTGQSLGRRHS